ncbi:MAG TPA: STAS domain-containing protein [Bryobacteraceae bacterium]|jgi:anti-sigma B factor antagonist|nr:STAS domain-containing protein [Bryobacteraceae bacterium]
MTNLEMIRADAAGIPVLRLRGRLTLGEGSKALRGCISDLAAEGHKSLMLDLGEVSYMDSSGLGALVAGYNALKAQSGAMALFNVPKRIVNLLEMSRLTSLFPIFGTETEAAGHFSS